MYLFTKGAQAWLEWLNLEILRRYRERLEPFAHALDWWLAQLFSKALPSDWRQQLHALMAEQAARGYLIAPQGVNELESWIENWARYCRLSPDEPALGGQWIVTAQMRLAGSPPEAERLHGSEIDRGAFILAGFKSRPRAIAPARPAPPADGTAPRKWVNAQGVEIAGPGPETTDSFRMKVQFALAALDPQVAAWWKSPSVEGLVRSRSAWFFQFGYYAQVENDRPVIVVDQHFTAGETAQAIIREIRGGLFAHSPGAAFRLFNTLRGDVPKEFVEWRQRSFHEAAEYASVLAELYVTSIVSLSPGGDLLVTINDVEEHGLGWQQILSALPLMFHVWRRLRSITIEIVGKASRASRITIRGKLFERFSSLPLEEQERIIKEASAAATPAEAQATIERQVLAHESAKSGPTAPHVVAPGTKPPFPPPVAEVRAPIWKGKSKPYEPHVKAEASEEALAQKIHDLPDEAVIRWGKPVTSHGPDTISYNLRTKRITFWDDKWRSDRVRIKPSSTFQKDETMSNAIREAHEAINTSLLSEGDKAAARRSLQNGTFETRTHGAGESMNSTFGDHR